MMPFLLVLFAVASRLLPHPPNVAAITAIALASAWYVKDKRMALFLPLAAMCISDLVIGFYSWRIMLSVYLGFIGAGILGLYSKKSAIWIRITLIPLAASSLFFLVTNAAVWAFGTMYPHTLVGLAESYAMALPFFRNSLVGDLFFTALLVGVFEFVQIKRARFVQTRARSPEPTQPSAS